MNPEHSTSSVLRYDSVSGVSLVAIGILANLFSIDLYMDIMILGIAVVIFTPFAGLLVSFIAFSIGKEICACGACPDIGIRNESGCRSVAHVGK